MYVTDRAMQIVIDKSYLQAASTETMQRLCKDDTVLFTETLLYELLTTDESERNAWFAKIPATYNPVSIIPRPGPLLRFENEHRRAAWPLVEHQLQVPFRFNPRLASGTFQHSLNEQFALAEWEQEIEREAKTFHEVATGVSAWCSRLRKVSGDDLRKGCEELKREACTDPAVVQNVYRSLELEGFACASLLDPSWVLFRWIQAHLLFSLDHVARYGFADLNEVPKGIEHDIHDMQYLLFGCLCGALATGDKAIRRNFQLACPEGTLIG